MCQDQKNPYIRFWHSTLYYYDNTRTVVILSDLLRIHEEYYDTLIYVMPLESTQGPCAQAYDHQSNLTKERERYHYHYKASKSVEEYI